MTRLMSCAPAPSGWRHENPRRIEDWRCVRYLIAVWQCRYFWLSLVKMDLRTRYRRSILGMGWSLLNPLAMTVILCVAFHEIFHIPVRRYAPILLTGLACWNYLFTVVLQGCDCLFHGEKYIRQYPVPMAVYPLRTALGGTVHFGIALAVVLALVWCLNGFGNAAALWSLGPAVLLWLVLAWSLAVLAGFANVFFQDTKHLAEIGFQLLFYLTPIMYTAEDMREKSPCLARLLTWNPLAPFLDLVRTPVLTGHVPSAATVATAGGVALATTAGAVLTLVWLQRRVIFHL